MQVLPAELADVSPGEEYARMDLGNRPDGLKDGVHTGGVWISPDGSEVWKPLDCRPHPGATERYPTQEAECLAEMVGKPGFPDNWRVVEQNGRRWLVRARCYLWPQDREWLIDPPYELVENAIFVLNEAGWEYNDLPQLAYDPSVGEWFLMDCSAAWKPEKWQKNWHGDRDRVNRWYELMGQEWTADLRRRGYHVYHAVQLPAFQDVSKEPYDVEDALYPLGEDERRQYVYVYASCNRPISYLWARIDGVKYLRADTNKSGHVWTWVVADHLLDAETIHKYELSFAYRPWP